MGNVQRFHLALLMAGSLLVVGCVTSSRPPIRGTESVTIQPATGGTQAANARPDRTTFLRKQAVSGTFTASSGMGSTVKGALPAELGPSSGATPSAYQRMTRAVVHNPVSEAVGAAVGRSTTFVKSSFAKLTTPRVDPPSDPLSLATKTRAPGADLHIALARISARAGNPDQAATQYAKALKIEPDNLDALLGYAHLLDRQGRFQEAIDRYREAVAKHADSARALNDLGLCYARSGHRDESLATLQRAVELKPLNKLYRNNLATVLVELGRTDEALAHLTKVHGQAVAHYNLGVMLHQRGLDAQAADHFSIALRMDSNLSQAKAWLARLEHGRRAPDPRGPATAAGTEAQSEPVVVGTPRREMIYRPAYPKSRQRSAPAASPVHLPVLQNPQQVQIPPSPDQVDRYPTSARPGITSPY